jgi:hypothetical protein
MVDIKQVQQLADVTDTQGWILVFVRYLLFSPNEKPINKKHLAKLSQEIINFEYRALKHINNNRNRNNKLARGA